MARRPRKTTRGLPARKTSLRTSTRLPDDSEELVYSPIKDSEDLDVEPTRMRVHSRPKLSPASQLAPHRDYSEHELTSVPAPIPDTGLPPPSADTTTLAQLPVFPSQTLAPSSDSLMPPKSTFVPLPYLKTLNLTEVEEAASRSSLAIHSTPATQPLTITKVGSDPRGHQSNTPRLSTAAVIAIAVSGGLAILIVVILVKLIRRPNRRRTPTPSLPILHDEMFADDKVESEGSPIFGGKECSSPTFQSGAKGNTGLWTWTQYNSGIPKPAPTVTVTRSSSQGQHLNANQGTHQDSAGVASGDGTCAAGQNQGQSAFVGYGSKSKNQIPLQPVQSAITRAVSRLSTISMSLYPNSPGEYSQVGVDVGLAIDGVARDEPVSAAEPKSKEKTAGARNRSSMIAPPGSSKDAAALRRSQSFAYGGMEPISGNRGQMNGGRARIKSTYYTPSAYPRTSKQEQRGDGRRGRDLTSALGLTSPIPPSPQPTLYPDDSMSVIGEAKKVTLTGRGQKGVGEQCESPPSDAAALGSLMMVDFAGSKSTASLVNIRPNEGGRSVEDRPPRVPSPPPIPSLAQMAFDQEYHSPTYSIYGLYDGDRKSRC